MSGSRHDGEGSRSGGPEPAPPRLRALLAMALHPVDRRFAMADLDEEFEQRCTEAGPRAARRWYRAQVTRSLVPALRGRWIHRRSARGDGTTWEGAMWGSVHDLASDARVAFRSLRRAPGVLLITVTSLGVGIGATTAVFGIANSLLFRGAVGIQDPETLVAIYTTEDDGEAYGTSSFPDYVDLLDETDAIQSASAVQIRVLAAGEGGEVRSLFAEEVTGNYFAVTGIRPVLGRGLLPDESVDAGGAERTVVISHDLWEREFDRDPRVLTRTLRLNGYVHTIVGVMPDGIMSRRVPLEPDVWVPLGSVGVDNAALRRDRDHRAYVILARRAEGVSQEALNSQLGVLSSRLQSEYGDAWHDELGNPRAFSLLDEGDSRLRPGARAVLGGFAFFLMSAAGLVGIGNPNALRGRKGKVGRGFWRCKQPGMG